MPKPCDLELTNGLPVFLDQLARALRRALSTDTVDHAEIGKSAGAWRELKRFYISPGLTSEEMTIFLATDLADAEHEPDPEERIEIVPWPLDDLDGAIEACADSKSLVGLMLLRDLLR